MTIDIPEDVALRLEELAEQHDADPGDLLRDMIERYAKERLGDDERWATLADLARHAKEMNMASPEPVNTAKRSREILNTEYADYLKSRIDP
ncbi:MAG: hypothetical protein OXT68_04810 [Chloroflexota bacterium]|nr:hypothetical protein [Chloroflexota bacterium]MDE2950068.1 hypothetical protein [Chloroflexota bacterium]